MKRAVVIGSALAAVFGAGIGGFAAWRLDEHQNERLTEEIDRLRSELRGEEEKSTKNAHMLVDMIGKVELRLGDWISETSPRGK